MFSVAKHFHSPRWRTTEDLHNLYEILKHVKVFETNDISCVQFVQQGGEEYSHKIRSSELHLEESDSGLEIFIPQARKRQELCFARALPTRLFEWMTTNPSTRGSSATNDRNHSIVKDILKEDSDVYNEILLKEGILEIDIADADHSDEEDSASIDSARGEASAQSDSTEIGSNMATPSTEVSSPRMDFDQDELLPTVVHQDVIAARSRFAVSRGTNRPITQEAPLDISVESIEESTYIQREVVSADLQYPGLLSQVISAARKGLFPTKGIFDLDALRTSLPSFGTSNVNSYEIDNYGFSSARSFPQLERDKMIGAAGELYVRYPKPQSGYSFKVYIH